MAKIIGKMVKRIARFFWAISNKLFYISAKLLKEKIGCYETKTYYGETTELLITWDDKMGVKKAAIIDDK